MTGSQPTVQVLVVARWPLGGIRTYMKYVYRSFPAHYRITLLVPSTQEDAALEQDARELGLSLVICPRGAGMRGLVLAAFRELRRRRYQVIQSQGFVSALAVYPANLWFRVPHLLTVHGILEEKYLKGRLAFLKRGLLGHVLGRLDLVYAVSQDMLEHLYEQFPSLRSARCRKAVIPNGIDVGTFAPAAGGSRELRRRLGIPEEDFLFGFLGRFMQQKGFDHLLRALELLEGEGRRYHLLAVGSGDYLEHYRKLAAQLGVERRITFIPFQSSVAEIYAELDAVVMPSIWEASGLLAMEALCMGIPLIASNCIGLRETVAGTPALVFESGEHRQLAECMRGVLEATPRDTFRSFAPKARQRYDVAHTARELRTLMDGMLHA